MKILVTGGYGFIGGHCTAALMGAGHVVVRGGRGESRDLNLPPSRHLKMDFLRDFDVAVWKQRLVGFDLVINAVGTLGGSNARELDALHTKAPIALFSACAALGVKAINISALGADEQARSRFHLTKRAADTHLLAVQPDSIILQPSLVYGAGGASARLFDQLASLPVIPLPGSGDQAVQPVHIDDLVAVVVVLAARHAPTSRIIPVVGPAPLSLRAFLASLRRALGMGDAHFVPLPLGLVSIGVRIASALGAAWASRESLDMLARGNTADPGPMRYLLGRAARPVEAFVQESSRDSARLAAKAGWLSLLLRVSIAFVWFAAALVSAGVYPIEESVAMVEQTGVTGVPALALVYLGVGVDAAFGIGTLVMRHRRLLWLAQMAVIVSYTAIISIWLPEYWLHPFGPVVKNIPLLAAIYALWELERELERR